MKELSIEEKAKRYDDRLEKAKKWYDVNTNEGYRGIFEDIFPELKESKDERMRNVAINACKYMVDNFENSTKQYEDAIVWLENQGEKKTNDMVEPKFKVGDWVVWDNKISCHIDNIYQGKESLMYTITDVHNMTRSYSVKSFDNNAHLWTIQDAKDGDVLALSYASRNYIQIYKRLYEKGFKTIMSIYCFYCVEENTYYDESDSFHAMNQGEIITPATKEQRDLLFLKIKEAGYEWDDEKKELKRIEPKFKIGQIIKKEGFNLGFTIVKIEDGFYYNDEGDYFPFTDQDNWELVEQKTAWSEYDKKKLSECCSIIKQWQDKQDDYYYEGKFDYADWLKYRVQLQPKIEWTLRDRNLMSAAIAFVKQNNSFNCWAGVTKDGVLAFLRSLIPPQNTWKPSDEQMDALRYVTNFDYGGHKAMLVSLYEQLKKLREE